MHQCIKGFWQGKEVFIPATKAPFERNEVRYAEASFFDEVADEGEGVLSRPVGLRLPHWEEYAKDDKGSVELSFKPTRRGGRRKRGYTGGSEIVKQTMGDIVAPFQSLLKKGVPFVWGEPQQKSLERVKEVLSSPATMTPPIKDPIRYILSRPILAGRAAKWLLVLGQFDLFVAQPKTIKSQALSDLLAYFPTQADEVVTLDSMPGDVDAKIIGVCELCIIGDSNLVVKQTNGEYALKEPTLAPYRELTRVMLDHFQSVRCEHSPRPSNRYADALATLTSKIHIPGQKEEISLLVQRWSVPGPLAGMTEYYLGEVSKEADWRTPIIEQLKERKSSNLRFLKSYTMIQGALYYRGPNGILARCISPEEAKERLRASHKQWCGRKGLHCIAGCRELDTIGQL
ncbi:hypothetical protein COLO4_06643 [Corchorus olitorius]|uniref:RNase H type-1 domain-containing protein n=1 Tax=Corchorus olitorius TaxID=93759 RepID=A0A1R3KMN1_9ROSI|nr:hypothetical protein COLO4_06643 [Corchorus olitorius]